MTDSDKKEPAKGGGGPSGGGGPKEPLWTLEKIRGLSDADVRGLKANAERRANQSVAEMCAVVLEERRRSLKPDTTKRGSITRTVKDTRDKKDSAASPEKSAARRTNRPRRPKISISAHFTNLGATLKNIRWSWGAVREDSGEVILRVWTDEVREIDGNKYVQLTNMARFGASKHPGFRERLSHIELLQSGSGALLFFCEAKDISAVPRKIAGFDEKLSRATNLIEIKDDTWVGIGDRV